MTKTLRLSYAYTSNEFYPDFYLWHQDALRFLQTRGLDTENGNVTIHNAPEGSAEGAQEYRLHAIVKPTEGQTLDLFLPYNVPEGDWYFLYEELDADGKPTGPAIRYELGQGEVLTLA